LEERLALLVDERMVLKAFPQWPEQRVEALRDAIGRASQLRRLYAYEGVMSHTYEWVMSHTYEGVMSHTYEWVMSHTYEWVMSHTYEW